MKLSQILINPMLEKEFLLRMRTMRSPMAIAMYLCAFAVFGFGFMYMANYNNDVMDPDTSRQFFYFLTFTQLALISFMTPGLTAGVISGEREKQTLNILLTTQLSSTAIIMSKLIASISFMLVIVVSTLPLYSIVFLYGGISPWQVINVFIFFIFVMFVLASLGLMFSTLSKRTMVSVITSYGMLLYIYGFTAFVAFLIEMVSMRGMGSGSGNDIAFYILATNPAAAMYSLLDSEASSNMLNYWPSIKFWHVFVPFYSVLAVIALWLSIRYLRPVLSKRSKSPQEKQPAEA